MQFPEIVASFDSAARGGYDVMVAFQVREAYSRFVFGINMAAVMATVARWFAWLEDRLAVDRAVLGVWELLLSQCGGA